jgi:hypothetical protein
LHDVTLDQVRIFQTDKDTLFEKFQDISVSQGNAELVSLIFDTVNNYYTPNAVRTSKLLAYRKFTTPDMQIVKNIMEVKYYDNLTNTYFDTNIAKGIYDVKIKHLESDNFALTFSMYSGRLHSAIVNRVKFNENYNDAKFVNLLSSEIYRGIASKDIIDMSYSHHNERLMVLTRDKNDRGGVYDINIEPTITNKTFPININKHDTERIETSYLKNVSFGSFIIPEYTPGYYVGNCENLNLENIYK